MKSCANATELYISMLSDIKFTRHGRMCTDGSSPKNGRTMVEAGPASTYILRNPLHSIVGCRSVDLKWALTNILHFFAATEEAAPLLRYNRHAERFLKNGRWEGAYGAKAVPGVRRCVEKLKASPTTTRAIVSMTDLDADEDINRPHCWSSLHFLANEGGNLDLIVYQRSLNLYGVMPYDCTLLCQILLHVASLTSIAPGYLYWTVGSLHTPEDKLNEPVEYKQRNTGINLPPALLIDSAECYSLLENPATYDPNAALATCVGWLTAEGEVRT